MPSLSAVASATPHQVEGGSTSAKLVPPKAPAPMRETAEVQSSQVPVMRAIRPAGLWLNCPCHRNLRSLRRPRLLQQPLLHHLFHRPHRAQLIKLASTTVGVMFKFWAASAVTPTLKTLSAQRRVRHYAKTMMFRSSGLGIRHLTWVDAGANPNSRAQALLGTILQSLLGTHAHATSEQVQTRVFYLGTC